MNSNSSQFLTVNSSIFALLGILLTQTCVSAPRTIKTAFHGGATWRALVRNIPTHDVRSTPFHQNIQLCEKRNNFLESIAQLFGMGQSKQQPAFDSKLPPSKYTSGQVLRTAARPLQQSTGGSIPSSRYYTTRKDSLPIISIDESGVVGDYNHYRTVALKSTSDRAVSILTNDVSMYIRSIDGGTFADKYREGDLGENILVGGVDYKYFQIGQRYTFSAENQSFNQKISGDQVIIEITEPMEPCANLCKLSYINDPTLDNAMERVGRCKGFIQAMGQKEGLRGWYARVIAGGLIQVGDSIFPITGINT